MPDCFTGRAEADCVPIELVSTENLAAHLSRLDKHQRAWVQGHHFEAAPGTHCELPGDNGRAAGVLCGVSEPFSIYDVACLPCALPVDDYRIANELNERQLELACLGWSLGAYHFSRYRKRKRESARLAFPPKARRERIRRLANAVYRTRDLINTSTEDMGPAELSAIAQEIAEQHGARFNEVRGENLKKLGFPAIHAVGRASHREPRLIELSWGEENHPAVVLVGKGVCFDTGGLNIKGPDGMRWMKKDMGGAAHALSLAELIMAEKTPVALRVLIPAVENAIGPNAYRPGDVVETRRGLTVEIGNTDAEGRVVLADALTAASEAKPNLIVDFATLTGAARIALGADLPALYANELALAQALLAAGDKTDDRLWHMPLYQPYAELLKSTVADLNNVSAGRYAGSITAALFLQCFVLHQTPWAHLDVYGWSDRDRPGRPEGGDAHGLRAVFDYLETMIKPC